MKQFNIPSEERLTLNPVPSGVQDAEFTNESHFKKQDLDEL